MANMNEFFQQPVFEMGMPPIAMPQEF